MVGIGRGGHRLTRVLIVGDVIDDIVVTPLGNVTRDSDTTSRIRATPGGSAANQAAWLAAAGVDVRFVARVGAADVSRHRVELEAFGVEAVLIADPDAPTGTIVVMLDADGNRTMYTDRGANLRLTTADVPLSLLDDVDALHVNGYALFSESPRSAVLSLIDEARRRAITVTADPSSSAYLEELGATTFLACYPRRHRVPAEPRRRPSAQRSDRTARRARMSSRALPGRGVEARIGWRAGRRW